MDETENAIAVNKIPCGASLLDGYVYMSKQTSSSELLTPLKILYQGENWYGSCARACCMALRRFGCEVVDVDCQTIVFPQLRRKSSRAILRLLRRRLIREYNDVLIDTASWFKPDVFLAFKGPFIDARTLQVLRQAGVMLYNYYPDPSDTFPDSIWDYDCVFYTKQHWLGQSFLDKFRRSVFIPHGYDPEIHRPWPLEPADTGAYGHDVSVIGVHTNHKEEILDDLISLMPSLDLAIWGDGWKERCRSQRLKPYIRGHAVFGTPYAKAISAAKIDLALMAGHPLGLEDQTTTRTYEITACGGFMLHERSAELLTLFTEDEEVACFESKEELVAKIEYYLGHPQERNEIARAGYRRCVPAYSYDNRMAQILSWHFQSRPSLSSTNNPEEALVGQNLPDPYLAGGARSDR
jgi:spore maturation protein CgeB